MLKKLLVAFIVIVALTGCSSAKQESNLQPKAKTIREHAQTFMFSVACNNTIYGLTNELIAAEKVGAVIGFVKRTVSPQPERNGDLACMATESPPITPKNGRLCRIKGVSSDEAIAIEILGGKFQKAVRTGGLKTNR